MLSALQFTKRIKKKEPTFRATLKLEEEVQKVQAPKAVQEVLDEFEDVTPTNYPRDFLQKGKSIMP